MIITKEYNIIKQFCGQMERTYPNIPNYVWCLKQRDLCKKDYCPYVETGLSVPDWGVRLR